MAGISAYARYIPRYRLDRSAVDVPLAIGVSASTRGQRAVAGHDEDTTTMAVEVATRALRGVEVAPEQLYLASSRPAYLEKTNASTVHAALGLPREVLALDLIGSPRCAGAALEFGLRGPGATLAVLSDIRVSQPGGTDERDGGDAAAAFVLTGGDGPVLARHLASAAVTDDLLDRWGVPGEPAARRWEERFGVETYDGLGRAAFERALKSAGLQTEQVAHLAVACTNSRAAAQFARASGVAKAAVLDDRLREVGNTGVAHAGVLLADALDRAGADEVIAVVILADGAQVHLFRTDASLPAWREARDAVASAESAPLAVGYSAFLTWRGMLQPEAPRRPDPIELAAAAVHRTSGWRLTYGGGECEACGQLQFPPQRICIGCGKVDSMKAVPMAHRTGSVVTSLKDRITWSLAPPAAFAVADLDGGGRVECEVTELGDVELQPGLKVELVFRRLYTARSGIHNYFWKLRPIAQEAG